MNPSESGNVREKSIVKAEPVKRETIAKIRSSRYARYSRFSGMKGEEQTFQIRKPLNVNVREDLKLQGRITYFQRAYVLARNVEYSSPEKQGSKESLYSAAKGAKQIDYRVFFQSEMDKILCSCDKNKSIPDNLSGLYVCMDIYSFLVIEGDQDMMANFFEELSLIHDTLWKESKVFMVEDNIGQTYFNVLHSRRSPGINVNEQFPPSTPNDESLMAVQHLYLRDKIKKLTVTFAEDIKNDESPLDNNMLPPDPYNRLLPEIQRIDLVLQAHKFYRSVQDFATTYTRPIVHPDEEALFWPISNNYTPLDIFERCEYEVNLTFGDYGKEEEKKPAEKGENERTSVLEEME